MKRHILYLLLITFIPFVCAAQKNAPLKYDIVSAGSGEPGTDLLKVSVYVSKSYMTEDMIKKAAVHGIIFRGYNDPSWGEKKALLGLPTDENDHAAFFKDFFKENGPYLNYATIVESGRETIKIDGRTYKMTAMVSVNESELKKVLENAGVLKKMTNGF